MVRTRHFTLVGVLLLILAGAAFGQRNPPLSYGDIFPEIPLSVPRDAAARDYLGLPDRETFTLSQIPADLLLVELLSIYCPHCQMQVPAYNELYALIEDTPTVRGRIRLLGVAVASGPEEVQRFAERFNVRFPILPDPRFEIWRAVGARSTPLTLYVRQDRPGHPGIVAGTHLGLNTDYRGLFSRLQELAAVPPAELRAQARQAERAKPVPPIYRGEDLRSRVRAAMTAAGEPLSAFAPVVLPSERQVYTALARTEDGPVRLFAEVVSRSSICDLCHDVHFIYVFDAKGRIVGFEALQLTKYGNIHWTQQDLARMRERVVGRSLTEPFPFDPTVDAVTSATITSALVFDSLAQGEQLLAELRAAGLR